MPAVTARRTPACLTGLKHEEAGVRRTFFEESCRKGASHASADDDGVDGRWEVWRGAVASEFLGGLSVPVTFGAVRHGEAGLAFGYLAENHDGDYVGERCEDENKVRRSRGARSGEFVSEKVL